MFTLLAPTQEGRLPCAFVGPDRRYRTEGVRRTPFSAVGPCGARLSSGCAWAQHFSRCHPERSEACLLVLTKEGPQAGISPRSSTGAPGFEVWPLRVPHARLLSVGLFAALPLRTWHRPACRRQASACAFLFRRGAACPARATLASRVFSRLLLDFGVTARPLRHRYRFSSAAIIARVNSAVVALPPTSLVTVFPSR